MPYFKCPQCQLMLHVAGPHIVTGDCPRCDVPMLHVPNRLTEEPLRPADERPPAPARAA